MFLKKKKMSQYITNESEIYFDDPDREDSDEEKLKENVKCIWNCLFVFFCVSNEKIIKLHLKHFELFIKYSYSF